MTPHQPFCLIVEAFYFVSIDSYASLYFIFCCEKTDNELLVLETIHKVAAKREESLSHFAKFSFTLFIKYVLTLDQYFENVCELDIIYGFDQVRTARDFCGFVKKRLLQCAGKVENRLIKEKER